MTEIQSISKGVLLVARGHSWEWKQLTWLGKITREVCLVFMVRRYGKILWFCDYVTAIGGSRIFESKFTETPPAIPS